MYRKYFKYTISIMIGIFLFGISTDIYSLVKTTKATNWILDTDWTLRCERDSENICATEEFEWGGEIYILQYYGKNPVVIIN